MHLSCMYNTYIYIYLYLHTQIYTNTHIIIHMYTVYTPTPQADTEPTRLTRIFS